MLLLFCIACTREYNSGDSVQEYVLSRDMLAGGRRKNTGTESLAILFL